jgi:hypothetical protein
MSIENRKDNRVAVDWLVRVGRRGLGVARGKVRNASLSGIFLETTLSLPKSEHVLLEIQAEEGSPILCEALIVRKMENGQHGIYGYGLQITKIDDDALQRLLEIISSRWMAQ